MTEKRYFKRMWEEEYYIFDSETISENEFDEKVEYEDYQAFADSMAGDTVVNRLNELHKENQSLKQINKGQELEIVRLHRLADDMSGVLRKLMIYDIYDEKQVLNIEMKVKKEELSCWDCEHCIQGEMIRYCELTDKWEDIPSNVCEYFEECFE